MNNTYRPGRREQGGAALFMALIFLLIMTILGVFGMNLSRMENLMAGNNQFQVRALNDAELLLAIAINEIEAEVAIPGEINPNAPGDHIYLKNGDEDDPDPARPDALDWSTFNCFSAVPSNGNASNEYCYVIEYMGLLPAEGGECTGTIGTGSQPPGCNRHIYRVTTRAETSRGARRTVQSVYVSQDLM